MSGPGSPSESDTERDGVLSYSAEWHAFAIGIYDGMKSWRTRPKGLPENSDVQKEPHYYKGGYVIGTVFQASIVLGLALAGGGVL